VGAEFAREVVKHTFVCPVRVATGVVDNAAHVRVVVDSCVVEATKLTPFAPPPEHFRFRLVAESVLAKEPAQPAILRRLSKFNDMGIPRPVTALMHVVVDMGTTHEKGP
jgi:hypothetical protein